jgi:hypothetical protein
MDLDDGLKNKLVVVGSPVKEGATVCSSAEGIPCLGRAFPVDACDVCCATTVRHRRAEGMEQRINKADQGAAH